MPMYAARTVVARIAKCPSRDRSTAKYFFRYQNKWTTKNIRKISFQNDCHGVSLMKSPKHPQSVTLLSRAEYPVRNVKKIINSRSAHVGDLHPVQKENCNAENNFENDHDHGDL